MDKTNRLEGKKVLLIDPNVKKENDKTFCFWATEQDEIYKDYKNIITSEWKSVQINNNNPESILPSSYFHINSIDLYNHAQQIIAKYDVTYLKEFVTKIHSQDTLFVETNDKSFRSRHVFDSRILKLKKPVDERYYISQSFYGLKVELIEGIFDNDVYRMMDFRVHQSNSTQFVYILPYSNKRALVELTRFGKEIIEIKEAEDLLKSYIKNNFGAFKITGIERGVIPMDPVLPKQSKKANWVSIGTRAGNVKPSTGYAFKNMYNQSKVICKSNTFRTKKQRINRRFHFYDQLLLIILTIWPQKGKSVFEQLFRVNSSSFVLKFLDEKSNLVEEFKMFSKLQIGLFLKAVLCWMNWRLKMYFTPILMIIAVFIPVKNVLSRDLEISIFQAIILVVGLLIVGIPHGALDHFTNAIDKEKKITFKFVSRYLILMLPVFLIWIWQPSIALVIFLIYSAWHFGQTDVKQWEVSSKIVGFLWGVIILTYLFVTHLKEFNLILSALNVPKIDYFTQMDNLGLVMITCGLTFSVFYRKLDWMLIVLFLFMSQFTNLIFAFGLYFIFHHSRLGWLHLKNSLQISHVNMYLKALPFNLGAVGLFFVFFSNVELSLNENIAYFFIFLSCVSFPHVLCMDKFYSKSV